MKPTESFSKWHEGQFGTRIRRREQRSDDALMAIISDGFYARVELERRHQWDADYKAALHGWCARRKTK